MSESEEYKRGWYDGYKAAKQTPQNPLFPPPMPDTPPEPWRYQKGLKCPKCGIDFNGSMGYVCPLNNCPVQPKITY